MTHSPARLTLMSAAILAAIGTGFAARGVTERRGGAGAHQRRRRCVSARINAQAPSPSFAPAAATHPHPERPARCPAVPPSDRRARRQGRAHRVQPGASQASDRPLLGLHACQRPRLLPQPAGDYWRRVSATVTQASGDEVRWQTVYDLLDDAGERRPDRNPALVDARRERPVPARSRVARRSSDRRHDRQVRLRRPVPAHAVARGDARPRSSMPRGSATRAPKASARCGSTSACRSKAATISRTSRSSIIRTTPAIRRPGASTASSASAQRDRAQADWTIKKGRREVIRHRLVVYTGTLNDVELTQRLDGIQRQPIDVCDAGAVGHRAAGGPRREVPHARASRVGDDDGRRATRSMPGPASR